MDKPIWWGWWAIILIINLISFSHAVYVVDVFFIVVCGVMSVVSGIFAYSSYKWPHFKWPEPDKSYLDERNHDGYY